MEPIHSSFAIFSNEEAEMIRAASLRVLEKVGVRVVDPSLRDTLIKHGARRAGDCVQFPEQLIWDAVAHAPRQVRLFGRDGSSLSSGDGVHRHGTAPSALAILENDLERRPSRYEDVAGLTRLADHLEGIDFLSAPAIAQDCPQEQTGLRTAEAVFCNTMKFCLAFALDRNEAETWIGMAEAVGALGESPVVGFAISPTSPLVLGKPTSDILMMAAQRELPIVTVPGGMAGATAPYTIAGALVLEHAEALAVVTIAQLERPGVPCVLGLASAVMDMPSGNISLGSPERTLLLNAAAPLAHMWGLPGYAPVGLSDSWDLDMQAGAEKTLSFVTNLASGLEFSSGVGRLEGGLLVSYEGLMIDHELLQMVRRYWRGMRVTRETLAEEVIARIGPGKDYLTDPHTIRFLHGEEYGRFGLANRRGKAQGGWRMKEEAHRAVQRILGGQPSRVPSDQQAEIKAFVGRLVSKQ